MTSSKAMWRVQGMQTLQTLSGTPRGVLWQRDVRLRQRPNYPFEGGRGGRPGRNKSRKAKGATRGGSYAPPVQEQGGACLDVRKGDRIRDEEGNPLQKMLNSMWWETGPSSGGARVPEKTDNAACPRLHIGSSSEFRQDAFQNPSCFLLAWYERWCGAFLQIMRHMPAHHQQGQNTKSSPSEDATDRPTLQESGKSQTYSLKCSHTLQIQYLWKNLILCHEHCVDSGQICTGEDLCIGYLLQPLYAKKLSEAGCVEIVRFSSVSLVDGPCFTAIQQSSSKLHNNVDDGGEIEKLWIESWNKLNKNRSWLKQTTQLIEKKWQRVHNSKLKEEIEEVFRTQCVWVHPNERCYRVASVRVDVPLDHWAQAVAGDPHVGKLGRCGITGLGSVEWEREKTPRNDLKDQGGCLCFFSSYLLGGGGGGAR